MLAIKNKAQIIEIEHYCQKHTQAEPVLLQTLTEETQATMQGSVMLTGRTEGRLLKLLINLCQAVNVLEIGMYTGYSALSMAEALPSHGKLITCEINTEAEEVARKYFQRSPHGHKIDIKMGPALKTIQKISETLDFVFIDADKQNVINYFEAVLPKVKSGGLIVVDNALWGGEVLSPTEIQGEMLDALNKQVESDHRVENVLLTVRDGINIIRKR